MRKVNLLKGFIGVCIVLCLSGAGLVYAGRSDMTGATFRMQKTEGTVHVTDEKSNNITLTESMLLYSGDSVQTDKKSYAYINLDDSKLIKIDELSKASLRKSGKNLELGVDEGSVYFEVSKKLDNDESMVIGDSVISLSIRGTTGVFCRRLINGSVHHIIYLFEGKATVSVAGVGSFQIWGGEQIDYIENTGELDRKLISVRDIPGFSLVEIRSKTDVASKVAASGIDINWITNNADNKLLSDQANNENLYGGTFDNNIKSNTSVVGGNGSSSGGSSGNSGGNGGNSGNQTGSNTTTSGGLENTEGKQETKPEEGENPGEEPEAKAEIKIKGSSIIRDNATGLISYENENGKILTVGLRQECELYLDLLASGMISDFEITVSDCLESSKEENFYNNGVISRIAQTTDSSLVFENETNVDTEFELNNSCTVYYMYLNSDKSYLKASDIILGASNSTGQLHVSAGKLQADNIRSVNGQITARNSGIIEISGQLINQEFLWLRCDTKADVSCQTIVNDGTCSIKNTENAINPTLSGVTLINNKILYIDYGLSLKRWENRSESYFGPYHQEQTVDSTYPITVSNGLIISEFQKAADEPVYLSTDEMTPVSGTYEGECTLLYSSAQNRYILSTSSESGGSESTDTGDGSESYTGQVVSYDGSSIVINDESTSQEKTITLGKASSMMNSLNSCGVITDFKATIEKNSEGKYIVTKAEQISESAVTVNSAVSVDDETLTLKGECTIENDFNLSGSSVVNFNTVNIVNNGRRGWVIADDSSTINANTINVTDGLFQTMGNSSLNITNKMEVTESLDWTYESGAQIGEFELVITSGLCIIDTLDPTPDEVFRNVSIVNNGELLISDTTVKSLTGSGTSGPVVAG